MSDNHLPTVEQILMNALDELDHARNDMDEAASWMRSDWQPLDSPLTPGQAIARTAVFAEVGVAKAAIDRATAAIRVAQHTGEQP